MLRLACVVLLAGAPAFAEDLEGARDNFDTVVRGYASQRSSDDGIWTLKTRGAGKPLRLRYHGAERDTIHPVGGGRWKGIAVFVDATGRKKFFAEALVATGGELWDVKSFKWKTAEEAAVLRVAALKAARRRAERKPGPKGLLPDLVLADASGREIYLPDCPEAKCLTVYLAPWCPHCRAGTKAIKALRDLLKERGVPVRIIVGDAERDVVLAYAAEFGPDALLDPEKTMKAGGVPHFFVSQDGGAVLEDDSGINPDADAATVALALGL